MSRLASQLGGRWLALGLLLALAANVYGQRRERVFEEPELFKFHLDQVSAGAYAEGEYDTSSYKGSSQTVTTERLFVGPLLGLSLDGSVYHPYFLKYQAEMEGAFGWSEQMTRSFNSSTHTGEMDYLGRFNASIDLFSGKPLNGTVFGGYNRTFRDYDFFNRVEVDTMTYGARTFYHLGELTLNAYYTHTDEDVLDTYLGSSMHQDAAGFGAHDDRHNGNTDFRYTFNRYDFSQPGEPGALGPETDHIFAVSDFERFGSREQSQLQTRLTYDLRESEPQPSEQLDAFSSLNIEHNHNLHSSYNIGYDRYWLEGYASESYTADLQLSHQLYENLHSTLLIQGMDSETSATDSSGYSRRYGGGFSETYTRHLGTEHTLRISQSLQLDHTEQKGSSTVVNERHSFTGGGGAPGDSFFLNLPEVIPSTIVVMDGVRVKTYSPVLDYEVIQNGSRTLISLRPGNTIPSGSTVSVDYQAHPTPAGEYEDLTDVSEIRFDLWHGLLGLYGRAGLTLNNAPPELHALNMTSYSVGTDFHWRKLSLGAEYTLFHSDESDYKSLRLFQSYSLNLDRASSVGVNFSESFTDYMSAHRQEDDYRLMSFYRHAMGRRLRVNVEAGVDFRRGEGVDQTLVAVRPTLDYVVGKTTVGLMYDYEYSLLLDNELRNKHLFTLRLRRVF